MPGQRHRGLAVRQGDRLHRHHAIQVQRSRAGAVQDHRLRRDVDEDRSRHSRPMRSPGSCAKTTSRRDLLFAGTELGLFISWNGGRDWSPFQLNLPITPITDLRVHQGNLIAATSGRSLLDPRRPGADPAVQDGHPGLRDLSAGRRVSGQRRQRAERRPTTTSPGPTPSAA